MALESHEVLDTPPASRVLDDLAALTSPRGADRGHQPNRSAGKFFATEVWLRVQHAARKLVCVKALLEDDFLFPT
jgi:hypothetical protein